MSAAESQEYVVELNEAEFPFLSSKPSSKRADKGRRSGAERVADQATLVKTIHDPQHVLGKRRKARLTSTSSDTLATDVPYSLNRKNRWEQLDAANILKNAEASEVEVAVIEQTCRFPEWASGPASANTVHLLKTDGSVRSKHAKGKGAAASSLFDGLKERTSDAEEEESENVRVEYRICRPPVHHGSSGKSEKKRRQRRNKKVEIDEFEVSELETSVHIEDFDTYKPSRDFKFCLGDYIKELAPCAIEIRRQSIESVNPPEVETADFDDGPKPFDLMDISSITRAPGAFEIVYVNTSQWTDFNFHKQIEALAEDDKYSVKWIDANHQRAIADLTAALTEEECPQPELFVILERARKNTFQLIVNTSIAPHGSFSWRNIKDTIKYNKATSMDACLQIVIKMVAEWRLRQKVEPPRKEQSRFSARADNFRRTVNSDMMTKPATLVSEEEMRTLLRDKSQNVDEDPFERISDVSLDSDLSLSDDDIVVTETTYKRTCETCSEDAPEELFELDEFWQCRECLRTIIVNRIRSKNLPLDIPFVLDQNGSSFDVLPSLIPLPLIHFYTKLAALELMRVSDSEVSDILDCPGCQRCVRVERPNEYHACSCVGCGVTWCPDCRSEPHWPMTCQQFAEWSAKWDKQYPVEALGDELSEYIRRIICECGHVIEVGDLAERAECGSCGACFNPKTLKNANRPFVNWSPVTRKYIKRYNLNETGDLGAQMVTNIPVQRVIKKEYAEHCADARSLRFNRAKTMELIKKCRKLKESEPALLNFPKLRTTVLCLVEFGLGWVYTEKAAQSLKTSITQLFRQCKELENTLDTNTAMIGQRFNSLEAGTSKLIEQIKKSLDSSVHM